MQPEDEFLPWTEYVYLWVCPMPGGTYIKVGVTNNPDRRATEFRVSSPFRPSRHLICQCPDKPTAFKLERTILATFRDWKVRGEWIAMRAKRLDQFISACTGLARQDVSPKVRFRDHKPRRKNGEPFSSQHGL